MLNEKNLNFLEDIFLSRNIPVIKYGEKYLFFSPFCKKIASFNEFELEDKNAITNLEKLGFFKSTFQKNFNKDKITITLGLTNDCNFRCVYCYGNYGDLAKKKYMSSKFALKILKEIIKPEHKIVRITFFGGEPTLNMPTIKSCVEYVNSLKIEKKHFHISTNGFISDSNLNYFLKNNFTFNVSYDGTPEIQDKQRSLVGNKPSSKIVEKTIKRLLNKGAKFKVKCVITKYNVNKMTESINYLSSLGVKNIHFEKLSYFGRACNEKLEEPNAEEFISNFLSSLNLAKMLDVNIINSIYTNLFSPSSRYCMHIAGEVFMVGPRGIVTNCYEHLDDTNSPFYLGHFNNFNINKKNEIAERYNIEKIERCNVCPIKYICGGGCPQQNYIKTGKLFVPDENECRIKLELIKKIIIRMYCQGR